jgi:hypothetical protein
VVDRAYKTDLPKLRDSLQRLKEGFSDLGQTNTDWTTLRIDPLLDHLDALERLLHSREFSSEFSRLTKGVVLFHSDLVYFRTNVQGLKKLLESERRSSTKGNR